jgi:hypothetical protein
MAGVECWLTQHSSKLLSLYIYILSTSLSKASLWRCSLDRSGSTSPSGGVVAWSVLKWISSPTIYRGQVPWESGVPPSISREYSPPTHLLVLPNTVWGGNFTVESVVPPIRVLASDWLRMCFLAPWGVFSPFMDLHTNIHQHSWNSLVITPTTAVNVHLLCVYAGVDSLNLVLKSHQ